MSPAPTKRLRPEVYSEAFQTSTMEGFGKIVKDLELLTNLAKSYILGVWQSSEYASASLLTLDEGPYHIETSPLICSAMDWFVYDKDFVSEKVKELYFVFKSC